MNEPTDTLKAATASNSIAAAPAETTAAPVLIEEELLVEEISIDGMCGVY
jgi:mycofactocin precursor